MLKRINILMWKLIQVLGNLNLAIILLLTIALFSSLGTIIEQDKTTLFYEMNYPISNPLFGFLNSRIILNLGLDHVYKTFWFIAFLFLFGASLMSCTFSRQLPSLGLARLWQFYKKKDTLQKVELNFALTDSKLSNLSFALKEKNYNLLQEGPFLYAYRGLLGKIGPIIVHLSIVIILFGAILGNLSGFMVQELVPLKGIFHLQNIVSSGPFSYIPQNFEGYVKDFKITYSEEGNIDQFYSDLDILDTQGNSVASKTIYVNEPLRYNGITFYQTDWSILGLTLQVDDIVTLPLPLKSITTNGNTRFWITSLPLKNSENKPEELLIILEDLTGKFQVYTSKQVILGEQEVGSKFFINGHSIRVTDIVTFTGLQIKADPGIPFVYFGFLFLILSVLLSYVSYSQIWAIKKDNKLYLCGRTNRAVYAFEKEFIQLINDIKK
nr:c-type cytochrome biogenensis protein [Chroomonas debatzensis]